MSFRSYLLLFLLGLAVPLFIAQYQPIPGYLDADYYFAGGVQLASGKGFTEPYLWNYLDGVTSLPHPSHSYWMPLASMIAALGMWVTGETTYAAGRIFFLLIAAFVPLVTSALAYSFSKRRDLAFISGILSIFCAYNAPFIGVTDNFSPFMLLGGLYFLVAAQLLENSARARNWFLLGILSGLLNLARSDGLLWLGITFLFALFQWRIANYKPRNLYDVIRNFLPALLGFLVIMSPWYIRNWNIYGTLMSPGGSRALWLGVYDQTYIYPPSALTLNSFLDLGWKKILIDRISALGVNLMSGFAAHGEIILFPFIIMGVIRYRADERIKLAGAAWLILLFVMSFLFPFAGARGAFFHAGAALQPMWWSLAPLGLESLLDRFNKESYGSPKSRFIFHSMVVMVAVILTAYLVHYRFNVLGWGEGEDIYPAAETILMQSGIQPEDIVIVGNAPGYYIATGRSAISIPYGGAEAIRAVSKQFKADYIVFESKNAIPEAERAQFIYLGGIHDLYIYKIEP